MTIIIRRLRCKKCCRIHHELPDMIIPYKRHCTETIEAIIGGEAEKVSCEESTIRRIQSWWLAYRLYIEGVLRALRAKYDTRISAKSAPWEMIRAVVNAHLWVHTRSAFSTG